MNGENVEFFSSALQKFQRLKIMTMVIVYENIPEFLNESYCL